MKKKIALYAGIILFFIVLAYAFVPQVLDGKVVNQADTKGWVGMSHETVEWGKAHPDAPARWTGSMFSGMPNATIQPSTEGDLTQPLYDLLMLGKRPANFLVISLIGAFLMMLAFGAGPLAAAAGAIAVTFCSYNFQIIHAGHNTKMQAIAFIPWVMAALVYTYRKACCKAGDGNWKKWLPGTLLGAAFFGLAMSLQVKANHPQITWYLAVMVLVYVVVLFVWMMTENERRGRISRFLAASALLLVIGFAGIGTNASRLLPTMDYTPYSNRSDVSSDETSSEADIAAAHEAKLRYNTAWSYGWEELPNLLIPNYNGGSSDGSIDPAKSSLPGLGYKPSVCKHLPLYWGPQPMTEGPAYLGAVTVFLFILGLCFYKGKEKWWAVAAGVIAVLLALGSHFMWFTELFYYHAPLYSKFRTVSMALTILQFTLPVVGFLMLDSVVRSNEKTRTLRRRILIAGGAALLLCFALSAVMALTGSFDSGQYDPDLEAALGRDRRHLLWADTRRSMLLIAGAAVALLWGLGKNSRRKAATVLVAALVLVDLFAAGKRYLDSEDFVSLTNYKADFAQRPVDREILRDTDPSYRVLDLTVDPFNSSTPSYWHKNIGGYSAAKPAIYNRYIDSHLSPEINRIISAFNEAAQSAETVGDIEAALPFCEGLASLNCRYIIVDKDICLVYPYALGNAWFEENGAPVTMTSYSPDVLEYTVDSENGGRVVFSEVYYPEGWHLRLEDGSELPIGQYGDILRCADVPAGAHTLTMSYEPESYVTGRKVSLACSILLILLVLGSAYLFVDLTRKGEEGE